MASFSQTFIWRNIDYGQVLNLIANIQKNVYGFHSECISLVASRHLLLPLLLLPLWMSMLLRPSIFFISDILSLFEMNQMNETTTTTEFNCVCVCDFCALKILKKRWRVFSGHISDFYFYDRIKSRQNNFNRNTEAFSIHRTKTEIEWMFVCLKVVAIVDSFGQQFPFLNRNALLSIDWFKYGA